MVDGLSIIDGDGWSVEGARRTEKLEAVSGERSRNFRSFRTV
jgi:hypothetical protein